MTDNFFRGLVTVVWITVSSCPLVTFAEDEMALVKRMGCVSCHEPGPNKVGPTFHDIAVRYRDDPTQYELSEVRVSALNELPQGLRSRVVVALVGKQLVIRVFDSQGNLVIDKAEAELEDTDVVRDFKRRFEKLAILKTTNEKREDQQVIVKRVLQLVQSPQSRSRAALIQVIKNGGKGNWTSISHGAAMPPFSKRLTDTDVQWLVDRILATTQLKVMKQGLGTGTITSNPAGIDCGGTCSQSFGTPDSVTLTAAAASGSRFVRWEGDALGTSNSCTVTMDADRSVRAFFDLDPAIPPITIFTPEGLHQFLTDNPSVATPSRFLKALPDEFRRNWILMTRSESLQTGTADFPRLLLPNSQASAVFTIGLTSHRSYPGSHPNAIEYMQWDPSEKNFRFHEVIVADIPAIDVLMPDNTLRPTFPVRSRGVSIDDRKCSKCHSTQNVLNRSTYPGTTGVIPGTLKAKNKPNWDTYDSWGGAMPLNRDRIYQGSVEAAAFRKLLNPWTWQSNVPAREIMEQLDLQPPGPPPVPTEDVIDRHAGGTYDGHIEFKFDEGIFPILQEPLPVGDEPDIQTNYKFDGRVSVDSPTTVKRAGAKGRLHDSVFTTSDEGRAVQLFDLLGGLDGKFNAERVVDDLVHHRFATGSVPIDVRPIALAIQRGYVRVDEAANQVVGTEPLTAVPLAFFDQRNGMTINDLVRDTRDRARTLPRRKADIQKLNLDRSVDSYLANVPGGSTNGLIQQFGAATSQGSVLSLERLRQEVFRRPNDAGQPDVSVMNNFLPGYYVDRESYGQNTEMVALFRYFLEPLGVAVDKWSMGVRGRSRTYSFADVFGTYTNEISGLGTVLEGDPGSGITNSNDAAQVIAAVNRTLSASVLPSATAVPMYTDIQRIFNKSCIECHGGLNYPPYSNYLGRLDLSEDEDPPSGKSRLDRSYAMAMSQTTADPATSRIFIRITRPDELASPRLMPFGGPALSAVDIETIRRWIVGGRPSAAGDPHIQTIDGVNYDFQAAGEFVLLRDENLEIQMRQTAVDTEAPLGPNAHTGLTSCVSINTALALRIGPNRITYQPPLDGEPDPEGLQLRIDGKLTKLGPQGVQLAGTGRIMPTIAPGGLQIEIPGGTVIVVTPGWWDHQKLWYLNVDGQHVRATQGLMGPVAPGNWLPALPDGSLLGPRPEGLKQRFQTLYKKLGQAWRVTDKTTLFDYADGQSTKSFTVENWPSEEPENPCKAPEILGRPQQPPQTQLTREAATELCQDIVDPARRANAIHDVMFTGERGFAKTYLLADQIERHPIPTAPVLVFPKDDATDFEPSLNFSWQSSKSRVNAAISYRLLVWPVDEFPDHRHATALGVSNANLRSVAMPKLNRGKAYFWKVIADDERGGTVESETRRFEMKP